MARAVRSCAVLPVLLLARLASAADVDDLLPFVPMPTNALVVVRVGEIVKAERDRRAADATAERESRLAAALNIPPWVDVVVRASRVNPQAAAPTWTTAIVPLPSRISFNFLAQHENATVQDLAGRAAFHSSRGYVIELKPGLVGVMRNGSRQDAALWVVQSARDGGGMSGYLAEAAKSPGHLILAFDATNMIDPSGVRVQLAQSQVLEGNAQGQATAADLLVGLRGVRTALTLGDATQAEVRLDFSADVGQAAPMIKALFVEFLDDHGATLPELRGAEAAAEGNSVVLRTSISDDSLRKLTTLIAAPTQVVPASAEAAPQRTVKPSRAAEGPNLAASLAYYKEVSRLIRDLKGLLRNADDYVKTATWHENFARRIDELPVIGVDPELTAFGADTSKNFRALAASLRGVSVKIGTLNQAITYDIQVNTDTYTGYKYGAFGGYVPGPGELKSNVRQVRAAEAAAVAKGADDRSQIWQLIDDGQNRVRIAMSQKYGVDFDKGK